MNQSCAVSTKSITFHTNKLANPKDAILLATIIASLPTGKQSFTLADLMRSKATPTVHTTEALLTRLANHDIIEMRANKSTAKNSYHLINTKNSDTELRDLLKLIELDQDGPNPSISDLIESTLISECIEFIGDHWTIQASPSISDEFAAKKLINLLKIHPLSVVHMLLWRAIRNIQQSDIRLALNSERLKHPLSWIVDKAYEYHLHQTQVGSSAKSFTRRPDYKESVLSKILFRHHLKISNYYQNLLLL